MARTTFSGKLGDEICERIANGMSVREICVADDMPAASSVFKWLGLHKTFAEQYARACEARTEHIADEMLDIADNAENDWMERKNSDGEVIGEMLNSEHVQRSRLRIDTRKWLLGKLKPKKYGEKIQQEHDVADPLATLLRQISGTSRGLPSDD